MKNFAETVRNSADIVRVVSEYVSLKASGNALKGLCPFHSEKTPSFSVHRERQLFHCFGCGAGGDVFEFVKLAEKVSFPESVQIVAEKCGIPIPSEPGVSDRQVEERKRLLEFNERAALYFQKSLSSDGGASTAQQVLQKRKVESAFLERFRLGYAPQSGLLAALKPSDPVSTGLFLRNDRGEVYDRFRHRLIFPIWNDRGKTIGFGGRALGDVDPKYLNSPETPVYSKSSVLYALHLARESAQKAGKIVVVEGYFDCLSLHQNGIENVVASCGTSLTQQQVAILARYVPEVVMNYDPDAAGQNAMRRSIDLLLAKALRVRILHLPGGLDPDDFVRNEGGDAYRRLLDRAPYFWDYLMGQAMKSVEMSNPAVKADAVKDVLRFVAQIQDRVERLEVAKAVSEGFHVPEAIVLEQLNLTAGRPSARTKPSQLEAVSRPLLKDSEKQLIHALLQDRHTGRNIEPFLETEFLASARSYPVIKELVRNTEIGIEQIIESLEDDDLKKQVRAVVFEPFSRITQEQALASIAQLYDAHLVKKEKEIREQLKQCGSGAAPVELLRQQAQIAEEKSRVRALKP